MNGDKAAETAVVSFFHFVREAAGGQLLHFQVISQAFAAFALSGTAAISAVAIF